VRTVKLTPSSRSFRRVSLRANAVKMPGTAAVSFFGCVFSTFYGVWNSPEEDASNLAWRRSSIERCSDFASGSDVGEAALERPTFPLPNHLRPVELRLRALLSLYDPAGLFVVSARIGRISAA